MYRKVCDQCYQASYSCCKTGEWLCPVCYKDITHRKARDAKSKRHITYLPPNYDKLKERYHRQTDQSASFSTFI